MNVKRYSPRRPNRLSLEGTRARTKDGDDTERFLTKFLRLYQDGLARAPWEVKWTFEYSGLKPPAGEDDIMTAVFRIIARHLPASFLHPDVVNLAIKDRRVAERRGALLVAMTHPAWNRLEILKHLVNRLAHFRENAPADWQHWMFCIFGLIDILMLRILADVQQVALENGMAIKFEDSIATDNEMLARATETYRSTLMEWTNENDRPPFTKHDVWTALIQDKDMLDGVLASPSMLVDERARRVMENYALSMRDARLVVATMEQLGKVIDLSQDDGT